MPSIGKYVSASNSSHPVNGRLSARPGRWNQRASRAFRTNQPVLAGTSPEPVSFSSASGTIVEMIRADFAPTTRFGERLYRRGA